MYVRIREKTKPRSMILSRSCRKKARHAFSLFIFRLKSALWCLAMISPVKEATMFMMSSLNFSENLRFLGAVSVLVVARCSTIALIISSK